MTMESQAQSPPEATSRKGRKAKAAGAAALAAVLALSSTFAWTSFSQTATNEFRAEANVGGRLHDDFSFTKAKTNKDIYVENFTSEEDGAPIFARVQLKEYLEIGPRAGQAETDGKEVERYPQAATMDDTDTWAVYTPADTESIYRERFEWTEGGSTTFMPTFNKNKDSLDADINGSYRDEGGPYASYKEYAEGQSLEGSAIYDADDNAIDEGAGAIEGDNITTVTETHTAKATGSAAVMTMEQWKSEGSQPGPYWVYDTDGWAYWAEAIQPGEATGLILDKVELKAPTGDTWYYSIHATGEFVSEGEWKQEADTYYLDQAATKPITADAYTLLTAAANALHIPTPEWVAELKAKPVYDSNAGNASTNGAGITIDGIPYVKVAEEDDRALLFCYYGGRLPAMAFGDTIIWRDSSARAWLNETYYESLDQQLRARILTTSVSAGCYEDNKYKIHVTEDKLFLPACSDYTGILNSSSDVSLDRAHAGFLKGIGKGGMTRSMYEAESIQIDSVIGLYDENGYLRQLDPSDSSGAPYSLMWVDVSE